MRGDEDEIRALIHDLRNVEFGAVMRAQLLAVLRATLTGNGATLCRSIAAVRTARSLLAASTAAVRARHAKAAFRRLRSTPRLRRAIIE